jgi:kynureninase
LTTASSISRADAEQLDAADPLRGFRERFVIGDDQLVYLDGNSLGRLPRATVERVPELLAREWGERLIRAWTEGWMELPVAIGDRLGVDLLGARAGQVVIADSTTVCFYKLAAMALAARPGRTEIVTDANNFPTDRYVVEGLAERSGLVVRWIEGDVVDGPTVEQVAAAVGPRTALVTFTHVDYRSAAILDMEGITRIAHASGALVLWDLSHSVGAIPLALDAVGADLAVGCTYKYLNGGPGAPAFAYVRAEHHPLLRGQPIWGWLGRRDPFEMAPGYEPADGIRGLLSGTPSVIALGAVDEGIELAAEAGSAALHAKGMALTGLAIALADAALAPLGVEVGSPRDAARRGAHVALAHDDARSLCARLVAGGTIVDFRAPDVIRVGCSPLTTRFVDVWDGVAAIRKLLADDG